MTDRPSLFERMAALSGRGDSPSTAEPLPGTGPDTAIPVSDVSEEYAHIHIFGLRVIEQSYMVIDGRRFDVFKTTGRMREIWFELLNQSTAE